MGSASLPPELPPGTSPSLILTQPTASECQRIWTLSHPKWGSALSLEEYLSREAYLASIPPGLTNWILTTADDAADRGPRPVLSSCETIRKRAVACAPGGEVREGVAHGIASVFTDPATRGRGYARRMMGELGAQLAGWQAGAKGGEGKEARALFSVLFSDIGKTFYAKTGWTPFESIHLSFPVPAGLSESNGAGGRCGSGATPLTAADLPELCTADEALLRVRIREQARRGGKTCVALLPDEAALQWHLLREAFMTRRLFGKAPAVVGAAYGAPGKRVWAVWARGYHGPPEVTEGNTLHVLRFAVEDDEGGGEAHAAEGFRAILLAALAEAREWRAAEVHIWNPGTVLRRAAAASGLEHAVVHREEESIASLMWYGDGDVSGVEWVANEKFGWC